MLIGARTKRLTRNGEERRNHKWLHEKRDVQPECVEPKVGGTGEQHGAGEPSSQRVVYEAETTRRRRSTRLHRELDIGDQYVEPVLRLRGSCLEKRSGDDHFGRQFTSERVRDRPRESFTFVAHENFRPTHLKTVTASAFRKRNADARSRHPSAQVTDVDVDPLHTRPVPEDAHA